jgi:phage terminase large subunit-like protein
MAKKKPDNKLQIVDPNKFKPGEEIPLPEYISMAIKCGDLSKIKIRNWRALETSKLTDAEKGMRLIETKCFIPGGNKVGQPANLLLFQEVIFYLAIDLKPKNLFISLSRRNGKTFVQACFVLLHLVSFLSERNLSIGSFALAREQAAILFKQLADMIMLSPEIEPLVRIIPSSKKVVGLKTGAEYIAGSAEARNNLGRSIKYLVLDEAGSIQGADNEYTQMLRTSQGSFDDATFVAISTQSASDADFFSVAMDTAIRDQPKDTVVVLFETPKEFAIDDEDGWIYSNPGIGIFRSISDMRSQAESAKRIPAQEAGFSNLCLNRRTSMTGLWLAPSVWKSCATQPDLEVFLNNPVHMGLDLSMRNDLTAAVIASKDEFTGIVHVIPFVFAPEMGMRERAARDKAPYDIFIKQEQMVAVPGPTLDYEWAFGWLRQKLDDLGIAIDTVGYDRWRINEAKAAADRAGFVPGGWSEVGQGFKDMSPRIEHFETLLLQGKIAHGAHPLLNMSAANAVVVGDPAGNRKISKQMATQRIDPLVAAILAVGCFMGTPGKQELTEDSLLFI